MTKEPASMPPSLEIARNAKLRSIDEVAASSGLLPEEIDLYGRTKAKIDLSVLERLRDRPDGKLVCVSAITPTRFGEGKTTTAIALTEGLGKLGQRAALCLREPSLGPVFGIKGGGAGGGYAQVVPMEDLNLHFTGDIHAVGAANNLLAAMLDAHLLHGNELDIDPLTITWRRCLDMNDRALRDIVIGLGGKLNGIPRETGFDITAASEVMGILAVTCDLHDLHRRLAAITVARTRSGEPVTAGALHAAGPMSVLLKDAIRPNLIQTLEGQPALVHAGPFANIASGNNSVLADLVAMKLADLVVTESGFGSDMGLEKFMNIVTRASGILPAAVVLVATVKTLQTHGDGDMEKGAENLARHLGIVRSFGYDPIIALNRHPKDTRAELDQARELALAAGARAVLLSNGFEEGGAGATMLAEAVLEASEDTTSLEYTYAMGDSIATKIEKLAKLYGADGVELAPAARASIDKLTAEGLSELPICMAKTHLSLSHDVALGPSPVGYTLPVRDVRAYTGAGWLVALCGEMQTMPGLPAKPAAFGIDVDAQGLTVGLF
jgi:formate--tetrahydrofolate ligase